MVPAIKMAARIAALVSGFALLVVLFAVIKIPALDFSSITSAVSAGLAVFYHYIPGAQAIWTFILTLIAVTLAFYGLKWGFMAIKWALKVSEG